SSEEQDESMMFNHIGYLADFAGYFCMQMFGKPCN
ncbi:hypothetical protein AVEN_123688-1, partial [Araneus ventricosus]